MRDAINLAAAIEVAPYSQFEELQHLVWRCLSTGAISEDEAQSLDALIRKRRGDGAQRPAGATVAAAYAKHRAPRRRVSKDRAAAISHRRGLAGSGAFPWQIAARFPTGQQAVLTIIGREVQAHGDCRVTVQELADRAKVSRSTVQNAIREARSFGLISVEARRLSPVKNLANIVRIVSAEWRRWLKRARAVSGWDVNARKSSPQILRLKRPSQQSEAEGIRGELVTPPPTPSGAPGSGSG